MSWVGTLTMQDVHAFASTVSVVVGALMACIMLCEWFYKRAIERRKIGDTQRGDL